jgi:hypothetical protein
MVRLIGGRKCKEKYPLDCELEKVIADGEDITDLV